MIGKKMADKASLPPGTMVHVGVAPAGRTKISIIDYDQDNLQTVQAPKGEEIADYKTHPTVTWFKVEGVHEIDVITELGDIFNLHPLVTEDIVNTSQRPKLEEYDNYIFIVAKALAYDEHDKGLKSQQVSFVLGPGYLISLQENDKDIFGPVEERLRKSRGRIRRNGADYLVYALLDAIVDNYFVALERMGDEVEDLEDELLDRPTPDVMRRLHQLRREGISFRKAVWPLREVVNFLERGESELVQQSTLVYLRDVYDHLIQVMDAVETMRDLLAGMLDIYLSSVSNRMNEIMKVLTIIATLFIPLTFLAGVYGMNFKHMPELEWPWAYPAVLLIMLASVVSMLFYFHRKKWL